jgi:selenocysteine-specific elongation factor
MRERLRPSAMPLTVGTAGHIDHGKTWLVRALTGKDTDRLPEEQRRGISIDLGYAPLELPDGRRLSLIDVPGHERFVRTMVAGATGIDLFLLVVDAGEGPRPQTHEHLAVLRLLGVERGVVAVTKADAVDADTLTLRVAEAEELVPDTPVVAVSARTGDGLAELRTTLARVADDVRPRSNDGPARLFVDRVFTLRGIGTIATGTLWSGRIAPGDRLRAEPAGIDVRVRSVQVHDTPVDAAEAGQRVALSLPGVEVRQLRRGDALVAPETFTPSYRLDVALESLTEIPPRALVHHGTSASLARVVTRDDGVQLRLDTPVVAARGDRVVLRTGTTVGGGTVLDSNPPRSTRGAPVEQEPTAAASAPAKPTLSGREAEAEAVEATLGHEPVKVEDKNLARALEEAGRLVRIGDGYAISPAAYEAARDALVGELAQAERITLARFRDLCGTSRRTAQMLLERFDTDGLTRRIGDERILRRNAIRSRA